MRRNRKHPQTSPILRLLKWWLRELKDIIPDSWRPRIRPPTNMLWVQQKNGILTFWRRSRGGKQELGQLPLNSAHAQDRKVAFDALMSRVGRPPLGVVLSEEQSLRKSLRLPLAGAQNLRQLLAFELGRQTPFTHDQAYFDARIVSEDRAQQAMTVELVVAPRQQIEEMNACFQAWGVSPQFIALEVELAGKGDCFNLLPPEQRPKLSVVRYWAYAAMAAVTLLLLAAVLLHPLAQKRELAIALLAPLNQAQQRAHAVERLKEEQARVLIEYNTLGEAKLGRPPIVAMLEEITHLLPDNTWLQQLEIKAQAISLQGVSTGSSRLINLFEKSRFFEDAEFKSPLVKAPGGEERFQLAATIKPIEVSEVLAEQRKVAGNAHNTKARKGGAMKLTPLHHRLLALLLLGAVLALLVSAIYFPLQRAHQHYDEVIIDLQDRAARYLRIAAQKPLVEQNLADLKRRDASRFYLKASAPALAAAELQQMAQAVLDAHALKVESTQIGAHKDELPRRKITVNFRLRGQLGPIQHALYDLEATMPYLFLDNVVIRTTAARNFRPTPGVEPDVLLQFDLYGYARVSKPAMQKAPANERKS